LRVEQKARRSTITAPAQDERQMNGRLPAVFSEPFRANFGLAGEGRCLGEI
jgi:hypothetical protein